MPWWNRLLGEPSPEEESRRPDSGFAGVEAELARVRPLGPPPDPGAPGVVNRGPELLEWLGGRLAPPVLAALEQRRDQFAEAIVSDPPVTEGEPGGRRWQRSWRLFDGSAATLLVRVDLDEAEPPRVRALVAGTVCAEALCPSLPLDRERMAVTLEDALRAAIAAA